MKKQSLLIKQIERGYGIFLRNMPQRPLQIFPNKTSAKARLREYFKNVKGSDV